MRVALADPAPTGNKADVAQVTDEHPANVWRNDRVETHANRVDAVVSDAQAGKHAGVVLGVVVPESPEEE